MPMRNKKVKIGTVGIDAGMLYIGDPCYVIGRELGRMDWDVFLNMLYATSTLGDEGQWWQVKAPFPNPAAGSFQAGHVVTTGWGDGEYPVEVTTNREGRVASVTITFIGDKD